MIARHATPNQTIIAGGRTTKGGKRHTNEDAFFCDPEAGLFIVADGMGGENAGETASTVVVSVFPVMLNELLPPHGKRDRASVETALRGSLRRLSMELRRKSLRLPALAGLGSTAAILLVCGDTGFAAYAGDSRIYLFRKNALSRISQDQTTAAELVRTGLISEDAARNHPLSHRLEEYIGKIGDLNPGIAVVDLTPGDRWLLCSDGLNKGLSDAEIERILGKHADPAQASRILTETANAADGSDNITAIVADIR